MNFAEFSDKIRKKSKKIDLNLSDEMIEKLYLYMNLILEWNKKINLTAIVDPDDMIDKHFIDSLTTAKYIKDSDKVIDMGTGAGFPGIPLAIVKNNSEFLLADSLNKRINFLKIVIEELKLNNVQLIHARAEELGKNKNFREKFDISVSRAVANLSVLLEYTIPFVKVNGKIICLKGANVHKEIETAKNAVKILGGEIKNIDKFKLPETDYERNVLEIKKINNTPNKYPRKSGTPLKEPL